MFKKTPQKRVLFSRGTKLLVLGVFSTVLLTVSMLIGPAKQAHAVNSTLNFQARLMTSGGAIVPDGNYNVEFKLYNVSTGGSALWTETRINSDQVRVVNGYLTVNLGSVTAFPAIDWSQDLYLTMNIGGTAASPSWDGEMSPRLKLTATPYAFNAGQLGGVAASSYARQDASNTFTQTNTFSYSSGTNGIATLQSASTSNGLLTLDPGATNKLALRVSRGATTKLTIDGNGNLSTTGTVQGSTLNATSNIQTNGTTRIDSSGNLSNIGNIVGSGTLQMSGTGSSYLMGALGLGVTNPQGALSIANGAWITGVNAAGDGFVNLLQINANNEIQLGAALNVDGGIVLPTNAGQVSLVDLPVDATASAGTPESYTFRIGSTNLMTLYGESDGAGGAQNLRVSIGSSITPTHTLDIAGTAAATQFLQNGNNVCDSSGTGCPSGSGLGGSGTTNTIAMFTAGTTLGNSILTQTSSTIAVAGSLRLNVGTSTADTFTTPAGNSVKTAINIPLYDPGAAGQILAFGLPSTANATARGITVFDARTAGVIQPAIAVISPNENDIFGLSWNGLNTTASLETGSAAIALRPGGTNVKLWAGSTGVAIGNNFSSASYPLDVTGDINTSTQYRIGGTVICTSAGCTPTANSANYIQNTTTVQSANMYVQAATSGSVAAVIRANAAGTGDILDLKSGGGTNIATFSSTGAVLFQNSTDSANAFTINSSPTGTNENIFRVDSISERVAIGVVGGTPSAKLNIATGSTVGLRVYDNGAYNSLELANGTANTMAVDQYGATLHKTTTNSTSAFQVQDANTGIALNVDTSNLRVGIGGITTPAVSLDVQGGIQQTGLTTSNTGGADANKWTLMGTCTITVQYRQCISKIDILGGFDGSANSNTQATVSMRVKQQNAMAGAPYVNVTMNDTAELITKNDIVAVTTQNDATATVVKLYGRITNTFEQWYFAPTMNPDQSPSKWVWSQSAGFLAALPAGTQTTAVYGDSNANTLTIQPSANSTSALKVLNAAGTQTAFTVDSGNLRIGVGGNTTPQYAVDATGEINASVGLRVNGTSVCDTTGCIAKSGSGYYIHNQTTQQTANLNIVSAATNSVTALFQGAVGQTANILQINSGSGNALLTVGPSTVTVGYGGNTVTFGSGFEPTLAGNARHQQSIVLTPEYAGAVLDATNDATCSSANSGTMTSGLDLTNRMNYYKWSANGAAQCYDVVVQLQVPSDWAAWNGTPSVSTYTSDTTNGTLKLEVRDTAGTVETNNNFASVTPTTTTTWQSRPGGSLGGTYTAGQVMTLRIRMTSPNAGDVRLGNITLNYYSKY